MPTEIFRVTYFKNLMIACLGFVGIMLLQGCDTKIWW